MPTLMRLAKHSKRNKISSLNMHAPISSLTDKEATKINVLLALRRFAEGERSKVPGDSTQALRDQLDKIKDMQKVDALVIYYAGHGTAIGEHFYLLVVDGLNRKHGLGN